MKSVLRKRWNLLMELGLFPLRQEGRKAAPSAPLKTRRNGRRTAARTRAPRLKALRTDTSTCGRTGHAGQQGSPHNGQKPHGSAHSPQWGKVRSSEDHGRAAKATARQASGEGGRPFTSGNDRHGERGDTVTTQLGGTAGPHHGVHPSCHACTRACDRGAEPHGAGRGTRSRSLPTFNDKDNLFVQVCFYFH